MTKTVTIKYTLRNHNFSPVELFKILLAPHAVIDFPIGNKKKKNKENRKKEMQ